MDNVSRECVVVARAGLLSCELGEGTVILDLRSGIYYELDAVGARIWDLLRQPTSVQQICDAIVADYDVDPDRCESDLLTLLDSLVTEGLIGAYTAAHS